MSQEEHISSTVANQQQTLEKCIKESCKSNAIFIEYKVCGEHIRWYYKNVYRKDGMKYCPNIVRGCFYIIPEEKKLCDLCYVRCRILDRVRHKSKNINDEIKNQMIQECIQTTQYTRLIPELLEDNAENILIKEKWRLYIGGAYQRNIPWLIPYDYFKKNILNNCHYCNLKSNGLDRINNNSIYKEDQVLPCCFTCNQMKGKLDKEVFLGHIARILKFQIIRCNIVLNNFNDGIIWDFKNLEPQNKKRPMYSAYVFSAKKRNIEWSLTSSEFKKLYSSDCYYCGCKSLKGSYNGIDRINNDIGYLNENCVPCCEHCNFYKRNFTVDKFLNHILIIWNNHRSHIENQLWTELENPYNRQM